MYVYLTDFRKLYGTQNGKPADFNTFNQVFEHIIQKEMDFFKPCAVVSVGQVAKIALKNMLSLGMKKLHVPHPNARFKDKVNYMVSEIECNL